MVDFSDIEVVREFAASKDGTKVPVNILMKKGTKLDGSNPCWATGYGGYGISLQPGMNPTWRVLFDHGFVVAIANLRGGGRVRRGVAHGREPDPQTERLRRLRGRASVT